MTDRPNRLSQRSAQQSTGIFGEGNTDLVYHVARLNALKMGRFWYLIGDAPKRTIDSMPLEMAEAKGLLRPEYRRAA